MKRYRIRDRGALYRAIYGSGERFIVSGMTYPINDDEYPYVDIRVPDKICKWLNDWERARRKATRLVLGLDLR